MPYDPLTTPAPKGVLPYWLTARKTSVELMQLRLMQQLERAVKEQQRVPDKARIDP
jgi:hypothetical protein